MKRIIIDARISPGKVGGVQTFIEGIASGFKSNNNYGFQRYWFIEPSNSSWISHLIPAEDTVVPVVPQFRFELMEDIILSERKNIFGAKPEKHLDARLPREPKFVQQIKPKFVQFCIQDAFLTNFPSVYHPHDLQHMLYPENFTDEDLAWRDLAWPVYARRATKIVVATDHVKGDIVKYFGISRSKVVTIPLTLNQIKAPQGPKALPQKSSDLIHLIYPAAYYPHKNHDVLIKAMPIVLKSFPNLILHFTGDAMNRGSQIQLLIEEHGLIGKIVEHGWLNRPEFEQLMLKARLLVFPSKYDSASFPIDEAMSIGLPVACADTVPLRSQVGESGVYFDPDNAFDVADKIVTALKTPIKELESAFGINQVQTWGDIIERYYKLYESL